MEKIWARLLQLYQDKRLPHAILLMGDLTQSSVLAQKLEKLLLCQTPQQAHLYQEQSHPDRYYLGADDQGINIEDIRQVIDYLGQTAHQQGYRVVTLENADKMAPSAANALLKTLEEPAANICFILLAESKRLLPTIMSRCFVINIPQTTSISHQAPGISFFDTKNEELQQFVSSQPQEALYLFYYWLADIVRYMYQLPTARIYNAQEAAKMEKIAHQLSPRQVLTFLPRVVEAIKSISLPGINKQLLFEALFQEWALRVE